MASRRIVPAVITPRPRLPALSSLPDRRPVWIGDGGLPWSADEQTQSTSPKVECLWCRKTLGNGAIGTLPAQAWHGLQPCDHRSSERLQGNTFQTFFDGTFTSVGALSSQLKDQLHRVTEPIVVLVGFFLSPLFSLLSRLIQATAGPSPAAFPVDLSPPSSAVSGPPSRHGGNCRRPAQPQISDLWKNARMDAPRQVLLRPTSPGPLRQGPGFLPIYIGSLFAGCFHALRPAPSPRPARPG